MDYYLYDYESNSYEDDDEDIGANIDEQFIVQTTEPQFSDIFINCIHPSISQIASYIGTFLMWNIIFRCACQIGIVFF